MSRTKFNLEIFGNLPRRTIFSEDPKQKEKIVNILNRAINSELTDRQKEIVVDYYFGNLSISELSLKYGVNKSTVSRHISRSREKLKQAMEYGFFDLWATNLSTNGTLM